MKNSTKNDQEAQVNALQSELSAEELDAVSGGKVGVDVDTIISIGFFAAGAVRGGWRAIRGR